ncbi:MAG TPA: hypothetical protein VGG11_18745 [Xanthobacteraceae bacterium]
MSSPLDQEVHFERERARSLASYKAALDARDEELAEARNSIGPTSTRWFALDSESKAAQGTCQDIFATLNRLTDGKRIPHWFVVVLALGFAALEAPINKFMLDNILRGNNFDSYALSLFLTLIMLLLAHIAGTQARQIKGSYEDRMYWSKLAVSLIILAVLATCVGALTIGRAYYSTAPDAFISTNIFSEIQTRIHSVGLWAALGAALSDQAAFFLASLNLAGIAGAFFLAFTSHDSDVVYQAALDKAESSRIRLDNMARKYDRRLAQIGRKRYRKIQNYAAAYGAQNAEVISHKRARGAALTDDDHVDLSVYDFLLQQARNEIARESNSKASIRPKDLGHREDHASGTPQVIAMDRK